MKPSKAAALKYDPSQNNAPKVLASGKGKIAETIIAKAREYDIPLFANEALVESLVNLEVDSEIPRELYQAVVEVFIWLAKAEREMHT